LAVGVIFATSVASLALVGGCVCMMGTTAEEPAVWPEAARRSGGLLLPCAVLTFLAGFAGRMSWFSSAILAVQGLLIWYACAKGISPSPCTQVEGGGGGPMPVGPRNPHTDPPPDNRGRRKEGWLRLAMAIALCVIGAVAAVGGAIRMSLNPDFPPSLVSAATVLSPLLVAPLLLNGAALVQRGQAWAAHATHVGVVQLNLCALLPLAAMLWRARWSTPLNFPMSNWRIDAVLLILLACSLTPAAAGRWRPQRMEGCFYLVLYTAYVLGVIAVALG
jgi:Ca2+/Na+ antiporter